MTAEEFLQSWRVEAIERNCAELSKLDALIYEVVADAKRRGILRADLDKAAGGSVRAYVREAILALHRNVKPSLNDVLGRNDIG